jgi:glycosyltransferase involved in cell wall biosynthesis
MKILLTHRYFWPDHPNCGKILWHLTKHFSSQGHTIEVLTSLPSKNLNSKKIYAEKKEIIENIKIRRMDLCIEGKNPLKKIINAILLGFWINYLTIINRYDVVISTSVPPVMGGFFSSLAAKLIKARFIYFCMDLHPEVGKISKDFSNPILYTILKKIDNWSCSKANPVVVQSLDMKNSLLLRKGSSKFKIEIINNFSVPNEDSDKLFNEINFNSSDKKLMIIFAGNIGRFQALEKIIEAMVFLKNRRDIELIIIGDGNAKADLASRIKKTNVNVRLIDQQSVKVVKEMINKADIGLVSLSPNIYKYGYPGKIMTYLEQGKPIIAVLEKESEIVKLMEHENYGFCIPTSDPKKISQIFLKLAENNSWKAKMTNNALRAYEKHFSKNKILDKWENILLNKN